MKDNGGASPPKPPDHGAPWSEFLVYAIMRGASFLTTDERFWFVKNSSRGTTERGGANFWCLPLGAVLDSDRTTFFGELKNTSQGVFVA